MTEFQILQRAISNDIKLDPKMFKTDRIRHLAYHHFGITEDALYDTCSGIVYDAAAKFGYKKHLLNNPNICIVNNTKHHLGLFTIEDTKSKNATTRFAALNSLGYTPESFNDEFGYIRLSAYLKLGFTEESMTDPYPEISKRAKRYFKYKYKNDRGLNAFKAKYEVK